MSVANGQFVQELRLREWMDKYRNTLLRICAMYLSDWSLAEDAVQETFIKAWRSMDKFEGRNGCSEKTWPTSIAINTCKSYMRTRWYRDVDLMGMMQGFSAQADDMTFKDCSMLTDIAQLPDQYREVILLYFYRQMNQREISEALGVSRALVSYRLHKALNMIRRSLQKEEQMLP